MKEVQCPRCGKKEPYNKNIMQLCWECNGLHMTIVGLLNPKFNLMEKILNTKKESVENERSECM